MTGPNRAELVATVLQASRESSTLAVFFHTAIAEQIGLGATDEKTLFLLRRDGALTAGDIAQQTGLTTASVTNLIDRLERKGFVQRERDPADRRHVIVRPNEDKLAELDRLFDAIQASYTALLERYDDAQLATIADFLARSAEYTRAAMTEFRA
jgi:DNA-binding MarR family transcriptional regulator